MNTHQLLIASATGGTITVLMTDEQAKDAIRQALAHPPVQFIRLSDQGWEIDQSGHRSQLLKLPPEMMN